MKVFKNIQYVSISAIADQISEIKPFEQMTIKTISLPDTTPYSTISIIGKVSVDGIDVSSKIITCKKNYLQINKNKNGNQQFTFGKSLHTININGKIKKYKNKDKVQISYYEYEIL